MNRISLKTKVGIYFSAFAVAITAMEFVLFSIALKANFDFSARSILEKVGMIEATTIIICLFVAVIVENLAFIAMKAESEIDKKLDAAVQYDRIEQ